MDTPNQKLEDLWSIPLQLDRGELLVREWNRYLRKYRRSLKLTYDFSSCFFPKFKMSTKRGFFAENDLFFWFLRPQNRGGGFLPKICPKISKTLKFGLFWGIFASSGLVLQNSAAHQCTCL